MICFCPFLFHCIKVILESIIIRSIIILRKKRSINFVNIVENLFLHPLQEYVRINAHQNRTQIYRIIQVVLLCSKERTHLEVKAVQP